MNLKRSWSLSTRSLHAGRAGTAHRHWRRTLRWQARLNRLQAGAVQFNYWSVWTGPATTPQLAKKQGDLRLMNLTGPGGQHSQSRYHVDRISQTGFVSLLVDRVRSIVRIGGKELHLEGCDVLLELLTALIRARGEAVSIHALYQQVWSHPAVHRSQLKRVHYHVCRFRRMVEQMGVDIQVLTTCESAYRLTPGMSYLLVEAPQEQDSAVDIHGLLAQRGFVDNRTYRQLRSISRSLAARELRRMVTEGVLIQDGLGRAARYRLPERKLKAA